MLLYEMCLLAGNRGSLASMGKPTSSTLASLAGLFKERDERSVSQTPDAQLEEKSAETDPVDKDTLSKRRVRVNIFHSLKMIFLIN